MMAHAHKTHTSTTGVSPRRRGADDEASGEGDGGTLGPAVGGAVTMTVGGAVAMKVGELLGVPSFASVTRTAAPRNTGP